MIFPALHNLTSSLLRLRRNTFVDGFCPASTLFNNETADKCGRLVKGATSTGSSRGRYPTTPRHSWTRWLNSNHQCSRNGKREWCWHVSENISHLDSSEW